MGAVRDEELPVFAALCCKGGSFRQVWVKVNATFLLEFLKVVHSVDPPQHVGSKTGVKS